MIKNKGALNAFAALGCVFLTVINPAFTQGGKPDQGIPLNVLIDDSNVYAIRSDGSVYSDSLLNVRAEILSGNYFFDTNENKGDLGRRVNVYFPLDCAQCPASGPEDVYIATISSNYPADNLAVLRLGESWDKRFALNWNQGESSYVLRWNFPVDATHGNVRFTCTAEMGGACTQWTAMPTGPAGLYLKQFGKAGKLIGEVLVATVGMPFAMSLAQK